MSETSQFGSKTFIFVQSHKLSSSTSNHQVATQFIQLLVLKIIYAKFIKSAFVIFFPGLTLSSFPTLSILKAFLSQNSLYSSIE